MNQFDRFNDVVGDSAGIFDGSTTSIAGTQGGLRDFDTPTTTPRQDGVAVNMKCRNCGRPVELTVEYPELVCIKYGLSPHLVFQAFPTLKNQVQGVTEWRYSVENQGWAPVQNCTACQTWLPPIFSQDEAQHWIAKAKQFGWINPEGEKVVSQAAYTLQQNLAKRNLSR